MFSDTHKKRPRQLMTAIRILSATAAGQQSEHKHCERAALHLRRMNLPDTLFVIYAYSA